MSTGGSVLCVLAAGVMLCCCSQPPKPDLSAKLPAAVEQDSNFNDWIAWDWRIDRPQLIQLYISRNIQPPEPFVDYLEAHRYRAEVDSIGLQEFLALPPAEQDRRRQLAAEYYRKALGFRQLIHELWQDNLQNRAIADYWTWPDPSGAGDGITRTVGHLVKANGIDPSNPQSWYDLAYFTGVVGDQAEYRSCLDATLAAIDALPAAMADAYTGMRLRIALDYAWLLREQGHFTACIAWLDRAEKIIEEHPPDTPDLKREARLIRGLTWADMGWINEARNIASQLRGIKVWIRNWVVFNDQYAMRSVGSPGDKRAWDQRPMDFATNWILTLTYLKQDNRERALEILGDLKIYTLKEFPPSINYRFWNDLGRIHEQCGLMENARLCYGMAAVFRPYFVYYPMIGARGAARIHGQGGSGLPYFLSYRQFYIAGSVFSYAANCALAFEVESEPRRKAMLAREAIDKLSACRRRGVRPASALALRGRVHYFQGAVAEADTDLITAYRELKDLGREDPDVTLLLGILKFDRGDYTGSLPWFERYVELEPAKGLGWRAKGLAHAFADQPEAALLAFDRSLELEPESANGWYNRGLVHLQQQHWPQARADFTQAAALWPDNAEIARMLAIAEEGVVQTITLAPSRFTFRVSRQDSLRIARLKAGASLNLADEIISVDSDLATQWLNLPQERMTALLADLQASYAADPSSANRVHLAWGLLRAGQPEKVRDLLAGLWRQNTIAVEELSLLLEADRALGDPDRARTLAASLAGETEPIADARLWAAVAAICLDHGLYEFAELALNAAIRMDPYNSRLQAQKVLLQEALQRE